MSHDHLLDLIFKDLMLVLQTLCPWLRNYTFVYTPVTTHRAIYPKRVKFLCVNYTLKNSTLQEKSPFLMRPKHVKRPKSNIKEKTPSLSKSS